MVVVGGEANNMVGSVKRREPEWIFGVFSSPEHEVLMVSYCGQWLSVVRRRVSCVVRRPSTFDVYTL